MLYCKYKVEEEKDADYVIKMLNQGKTKGSESHYG